MLCSAEIDKQQGGVPGGFGLFFSKRNKAQGEAGRGGGGVSWQKVSHFVSNVQCRTEISCLNQDLLKLKGDCHGDFAVF